MSSEPSTARGRVELICGCMFSGKSGLLLDRLAAARSAGRRVAAFKHAIDHRYHATRIVTHDGQYIEAFPVDRAERVLALADGAEVVAIDEGQFFDADLLEVCRVLIGRGCDVVVAGLDRDAWGLPFEPIPSLAELADAVIRTQARCARCGAVAEFTQRLVPVEGRDMIGGPASYEPRCATCFVAPPLELRC